MNTEDEMIEKARADAKATGHEVVVCKTEAGFVMNVRADHLERSIENAKRKGHTVEIVTRCRP